eukprot:4865153-Pleurochrysis_carterae.AAC.3
MGGFTVSDEAYLSLEASETFFWETNSETNSASRISVCVCVDAPRRLCHESAAEACECGSIARVIDEASRDGPLQQAAVAGGADQKLLEQICAVRGRGQRQSRARATSASAGACVRCARSTCAASESPCSKRRQPPRWARPSTARAPGVPASSGGRRCARARLRARRYALNVL